MPCVILKKPQPFSYYLLGLLMVSACSLPFKAGIDVSEKAYFHNDGSGQFTISVNLAKVERFIKMASYYHRDPSRCTRAAVHQAFRQTAKRLKRVPGINKVTTARDSKALRFKLRFEFKNIQALNRAMRKICAHVDKKGMTYFRMSDRSFVRVDTQSIAKRLATHQTYDDSHVTSFDLDTFFKNSTYQFVYSFDKNIKKHSHKLARITQDRRTIILKQCIFAAREKNLSFSNKIVF